MVRMAHSVYSNTAKFDGSAVDLTNDQIRKVAPSIFATQAHESRSDRFVPIATIEILEGLRKNGFSVVGVQQSNTRDETQRGFAKHLVRLRQISTAQKYSVGDTVYEVVLKNANNGSASYNLLAGLYRIRCLNSLVAKTSTLDEIKVLHKGVDIQDRVIQGSFTVLDNASKVLAAPENWSKINMSKEAQQVLAETAHTIRFADAEGKINTPVKASQLLTVRRPEDNGNDLWTVFNRIQEGAIRGNLSAYGKDSHGNRRRFTTKSVDGIDQNVRLNAALFQMAEKMAAILA